MLIGPHGSSTRNSLSGSLPTPLTPHCSHLSALKVGGLSVFSVPLIRNTKLIGDGTLTIFREPDIGEASHAALNAAVAVRRNVAKLNLRRANSRLPSTDVCLGLHVGEVFSETLGALTGWTLQWLVPRSTK